MSNKIANMELIENLKAEMSDEEKTILKKELVKQLGRDHLEEMPLRDARKVLAHSMLETYHLISYDHEDIKTAFRQLVKKYLNGANAPEDEHKVCKELIEMLMRDDDIAV